ncbi:acyloxyacyl hydrolase [Coralloluteibacterium stylophorae]|uniref:Acyloxyacyl hydrolase n=1 Tax=Coralloluteibacterium stylophorae TaxID=1776034 RepID=A0AAP2CDP2_9GAMM|nr:acyloxyacyl hydrolase [Coralloluteibacterium stylophorae]MBS7457567.1 acyloxyacyl hydrolase [Coralloluteibacterium stylophorae]
MAHPRSLAAAILAIGLSAATLPAQAQQFEIAGGVAKKHEGETTEVFSAHWLPELRRIGNATLRADIAYYRVQGRDVDDTDWELEEDVDVFGAGARYEHDNGLVLGFAIAAQHGYTDALSGDPQFISQVGWRWRALTLSVRHISNAGYESPNQGESMVMAGFRF